MPKYLWLMLLVMSLATESSQAESQKRRCIKVQNDSNIFVDLIANKTGWGCDRKERIPGKSTYTFYPDASQCGDSEIWGQIWTSKLSRIEPGPGRMLACKDQTFKANESGTIIVKGKFDSAGKELERLECELKHHDSCE